MAKYKIIPSSRTIVQSPISIGHKAEKGVEAIEFDLTAWVETYGSGTLTVIMRRWGDAIPYPIALEIDENNKATWTLSDIDTAKAGMAYAQLNYIVGDEVVKKSDIYTFRVMDSLTGEGEPPEAYESWLEHLTRFAAEAMAEVLDIEGIVTDKTLTIDGGIADAKTVGDALAKKVDAADYSELSARVGRNTIALAEKADRSTTYTKTEVDQMIEDVEVETDTTLTISGAPADAKATGDALSALEDQFTEKTDQLKADLGDRTTFANTVFENGSVEYEPIYTNNSMNNTTGQQGDESPKRTSTPSLYYIPPHCNVFVKSYNVTVYTCIVYFYSDNKQYIGRTRSSDLGNEKNVPVIEGTRYLRFFVLRKDDGNLTPQDAVSAVTFECVYNGRVSVLDNEITALQEKTDKIAVNNNLLYGFKLNDGYYDTAQYSSDAYKYFAKIPVINGKTYIAYPRARMIYIYDANGTLINYLNQQNITQITADGDGFAYVTYYTADDLDSALFYEEGAKDVYSRDSFALSDDIIQRDALTNKKWAVLGDSFTAGADSGTIQGGAYAGQKIVYPYLIGNRTGINVLSFFGGGRTLAYPAVPGDFVNSVTCPGQSYYYQNIPSDADYVTIYLGINDHHHLTGGGDSEDPTGVIDLGTISDDTVATYYGAWNVVISWLIANRPNAHIGIIVSNGITSTSSQESAHPTAEQSLWRKAQIDIAEKYGIPYIDLNGDARTRAMIRTSNPNIPDTIKQKMIENWAVDYVGGNYHPNNAAHEFESYIIEAFLRTI